MWLSTEGIVAGQRLTLDYGSKISLPIIHQEICLRWTDYPLILPTLWFTMNLVEPDFSWRHVFFQETVGESPDSLYSGSQEGLA